EADEYDTAFFDKRSKFLHYRAEVAILNNLEFDHADIFADLGAIETQFHHWIRTLRSEGAIWVKADEPALERVLGRGHYTPIHRFTSAPPPTTATTTTATNADTARLILSPLPGGDEGCDRLEVWLDGKSHGVVRSPLWGDHNRANLAGALGAALSLGLPIGPLLEVVPGFLGIKRRMQLRGLEAGVRVFDDFAHHPTAIRTTVEGLRRNLRPAGRVLAVLEPRSNTMKMGVMRSRLAESLSGADQVFGFSGGLDWPLDEALSPLGTRAQTYTTVEALVAAVAKTATSGDDVLVMSNGAFGGIHERLLQALSRRPPIAYDVRG
ncbi:MAG: hypothetical protein RLZZ344_1635, partial [Pseudomonadota bacterium]